MNTNNEVKSNKRKASHCMVESKRRCRINSGYEKLKRVMQMPDNFTKAEILEVAAQRIKDYEENVKKVKIKNDVFMGADVKLDNELNVFMGADTKLDNEIIKIRESIDTELNLEWNSQWNEYWMGWKSI
jgi:hypothetical protein